MGTAVNGGVRVGQKLDLGIDHLLRLLARGGGIEVRERVTVHLLREQREIGADGGEIQRGHGGNGHPSSVRAAGLEGSGSAVPGLADRGSTVPG